MACNTTLGSRLFSLSPKSALLLLVCFLVAFIAFPNVGLAQRIHPTTFELGTLPTTIWDHSTTIVIYPPESVSVHIFTSYPPEVIINPDGRTTTFIEDHLTFLVISPYFVTEYILFPSNVIETDVNQISVTVCVETTSISTAIDDVPTTLSSCLLDSFVITQTEITLTSTSSSFGSQCFVSVGMATGSCYNFGCDLLDPVGDCFACASTTVLPPANFTSTPNPFPSNGDVVGVLAQALGPATCLSGGVISQFGTSACLPSSVSVSTTLTFFSVTSSSACLTYDNMSGCFNPNADCVFDPVNLSCVLGPTAVLVESTITSVCTEPNIDVGPPCLAASTFYTPTTIFITLSNSCFVDGSGNCVLNPQAYLSGCTFNQFGQCLTSLAETPINTTSLVYSVSSAGTCPSPFAVTSGLISTCLNPAAISTTTILTTIVITPNNLCDLGPEDVCLAIASPELCTLIDVYGRCALGSPFVTTFYSSSYTASVGPCVSSIILVPYSSITLTPSGNCLIDDLNECFPSSPVECPANSIINTSSFSTFTPFNLVDVLVLGTTTCVSSEINDDGTLTCAATGTETFISALTLTPTTLPNGVVCETFQEAPSCFIYPTGSCVYIDTIEQICMIQSPTFNVLVSTFSSSCISSAVVFGGGCVEFTSVLTSTTVALSLSGDCTVGLDGLCINYQGSGCTLNSYNQCFINTVGPNVDIALVSSYALTVTYTGGVTCALMNLDPPFCLASTTVTTASVIFITPNGGSCLIYDTNLDCFDYNPNCQIHDDNGDCLLTYASASTLLPTPYTTTCYSFFGADCVSERALYSSTLLLLTYSGVCQVNSARQCIPTPTFVAPPPDFYVQSSLSTPGP